MASKVYYNNIQYDILDAIQIENKEYLIMSNPHDLKDIRYIEKTIIDDKERYFLPPTNFSLQNNLNADLKRLQIHLIINKIVDIIKLEVVSGSLKNRDEIMNKVSRIKSFCATDLTLKSVVSDYKNLNSETFETIADYLIKYLELNISFKKEKIEEKPEGLDRPIKTSAGLNYDWLYDLSVEDLKKIASDKNRTSEELIYILDALDKRTKTENAIREYTSQAKVKTKTNDKAAFIDLLLLSLITGSFGLVLLISLF